MSAREIIEELPKLNKQELEEIVSKGRALLEGEDQEKQRGNGWRRYAGAVRGLPSDMALNHDHYLHGLPKILLER
jgi:hypothetical protein